MLVLLLTILVAYCGDWRVEAGGQVDADSHGITNVMFEDGPWSIALLTDTLDVRVSPELPRGRAWLAWRAEAGAAGLFISPWEDGARAPEQALFAGYFGADGGLVRYLPRGLWVGVELQARAWWFLATPATTIETPGWTNIATTRALAGWWKEAASVDLAAGVDLRDDRVSPHVFTRARWTPDWRVRPVMHLQAGWADGQDAITRTRLGGLNPYVIPLAGAAWAEFRVEDYLSCQAGPALHFESWDLEVAAHVAHFERRNELGLATRVVFRTRRLGVELSSGYSHTVERQQGAAISGFFLLNWSSS